ncbi:LANO_0G08680g1_1 [Lachancea nothofagi CBS 11611]|uniref:LANO_0G08680g1_1 n=1 Tax=Lachancea nothofagi CBS 11611 TaxID=1266666 RepID=A0A1G4KI74_9SACH|nr:LANO_0G08680g1_1 [Lachancea nothofagi CBS 11611]
MSIAIPQPPFKVKAHYSWSGETKSDLGFLENDIIQVTKIKGDWFYGTLMRNSKKYGYFPNNFVTIIEEKYNNFKLAKAFDEPSLTNKLPAADHSFYTSKQISGDSPYMGADKPQGKYRREGQVPRGSHKDMLYSSGGHKSSERSTHRHSQIEKIPQSHSTSNLASNRHKSTPHIDYMGTKNKLTSSENQRREAIAKNHSKRIGELPPLPPIPQIKERLKPKNTVPKSFSSNDLPDVSLNLDLDARVSYQRGNADFYDGHGPSESSLGTSSKVFSHSQYMNDSTTSSEDSFALMSDFSATSAGSFARHRFAKSFNDSMQRSQLAMEEGLIRSKNGSPGPKKLNGILKKLITKGGDLSPTSPTGSFPKLPDVGSLQLNTSHNEARGWVEAKAHLHRAQTLNSRERHERQMQALEENRDLVLHPQEYILDEINSNEVRHGRQPGLVDIELNCIDKEFIADMIKKRAKKGGTSSIESFSRQTITSAFRSHAEKLFATFIFCTETFALVDDNGLTDFGKEPSGLNKILHKPYCTPYELTWIFKRMANSLGIVCEIVIGFLKTPGANNMNFKYNHCWLRVLVNEEWRMVDVILGNMSNPIHEYINNSKADHAEAFYFLTQPLQFIYTHVPRLYQEQHVIPIVDQTIALSLPVVFPSYFHNELILHKFSNGLAKLYDNQIYECTIAIPNDVEVFTSVVVEDAEKMPNDNMDLSLVQIKHRKKERLAVIKALLPAGSSRGVLHIHSGIKGVQTTLANVHPLSMIVPLEHTGIAKSYEFVTRIPSKAVQKVDMYIKEPQNKYLFANNEYNFEVIQHPCDGVIYGSPGFGKYPKQALAIQSPSGKLYLMRKNDPNFEFGTWEVSINNKELQSGIWTGLATSDAGAGWCPFAEWKCV